MESPKVCLTLTGKTLAEDIKILNKYRDYVDIAELRVDFLTPDEQLNIRKFPSMANIPCLLTIRRECDGGRYVEGESSRTVLFAQALSFADEDRSKNFEYVDFEEDFHVSSLEDAALAFGTKIIRSFHDMNHPVKNIVERLKKMNKSGYEIPKIAFMPESLDDVTELFREAEKLEDNNHILIAMGKMGTASRILGYKLKNYLTYVSAPESQASLSSLAQLDPVKLVDLYRFRKLNNETKIFGITGWPLSGTSSPTIHNEGYRNHEMNCVYIPFPAPKFSQAMNFAKQLDVRGFSVTIPHKEDVLEKTDVCDESVQSIGASNTVVNIDGKWNCFNTDEHGFSQSLLEFLGAKNLRFRKVAIIGAGGAAKAIAYAVKKLHGNACIFNRTVSKAKNLADKYGFKYASLSIESYSILKKYSDIIIQTTSKGMHCNDESSIDNDPIYFYEFSGNENLFDIIYMPEKTPVMKKAEKAGCKVCNGYKMLQYQGYKQFELYTGAEY